MFNFFQDIKQGSPFDFAQRRNIQNKSYLEFHFPTDTPLVARLPLYENIEIKESKEANLVTYNPIGRNSALYAYTGASSRKLKISFALTLQHIQSMHDGAKVRFKPGDNPNKTREQIKKLMKLGKSVERAEIIGAIPKFGLGPEGVGDLVEELKVEKYAALLAQAEPNNWVKYVAWWVNLIRSSVMNNQSDTTQGPPTVRLTHGELYQNIPCICHSYDITYDKNAGMDVDSLLSRRILVNMDLEEFRAGDFGEYDRTAINITTRDNVTGWESIIAHSTTDPGSDIMAQSVDEAVQAALGGHERPGPVIDYARPPI